MTTPDRWREVLSDRYRLERELGRGGMATVYLARDLRHDRHVAVKVLEASIGAEGVERFVREIHIAAALTHPHVLGVYDSGESDGRLYYVMPYVDGETLRARLAREGALALSDAVRLLRELADALSHAHAHGVVHRDLKPENVLLSGGHAVVADFGIAKALAAATHGDGALRATLTATGMALGTPAYMAPEQAVGDAAMDHRADLYALGVIAYETLTGGHPFAGRSAQALAAAHLTETPAPIVERRSDVPPALAELVSHLLEKEPDHRPRDAGEVVRALDSVTASLGGTPRTGKALRRRIAVAGAALLVLVAGAASYVWAHHGDARGAGPRALHTEAVLAFTNTSGSTDDDYFSDGLTDELAHALSGIPGLRVAGRTSSYSFKGKAVAAQEIGRALGVEALIDGTVRRAGQRLRVTTQLVSTADGTVLSDSVYERQAADVFAVQDELTHAMVAALGPSLAPALRARARDSARTAELRRGTSDETAYDLYLKGRYYFNARGTDNLMRAAAAFRQAIARDPRFARAYAGLSMTYGVLPNYAPSPDDTLLSRAIAYAEHAVALDSTLGEAHGALGQAYAFELRLREALAEQRKFAELDPTNVTAHQWLGFAYLDHGRTEEAIAELARATEIDPLAPSVQAAYAVALWSARRFPEALAAARRMQAVDSTFHYGILALGCTQVFAGQPDSAIVTFQRGMRFHGDDSRMAGGLMLAYAADGRWNDAERIRRRLARPGGDRFDGIQAAFGDLLFGDREPLVRILTSDAGLKRYLASGGFLGCNPYLDPLWSDPRFRARMHALDIEPCATMRPWPFAIRPK
jgi:serine/threonine-protein kinase